MAPIRQKNDRERCRDQSKKPVERELGHALSEAFAGRPTKRNTNTRNHDGKNQFWLPKQAHDESCQKRPECCSVPGVDPFSSGPASPICYRTEGHHDRPAQNCERQQNQRQKSNSATPVGPFSPNSSPVKPPTIKKGSRPQQKRHDPYRAAKKLHALNSVRATSAIAGISAATATRIFSSSIALSANPISSCPRSRPSSITAVNMRVA